MKKLNLIMLLLVGSIATVSANAQTRFVGRAVEVLDGRTVVIDTDGRKLTAQVEFIEVPEPEQPLHQTVREHLEKLVIGKTVEFRPRGISPGKAIGQLYVNSADIALQMLRDGAAWQVPSAKSGQSESESAAYQYHQTQAKLEKRGVWGVKDLKPAWQFRAERNEAERQARIANENTSSTGGGSSYQRVSAGRPTVRPNSPWSDRNPHLKNPGPLVNGYNAASKTGYVGTSLMGTKPLESLPANQKMAVDITYLYKQDDKKGRSGKFMVTVFSAADEAQFLNTNTIKVVVDEKNAFVGRPVRSVAREEGRVVERLTYEVSRSAIEKMVYGGEVSINIGRHVIYPNQGLQLLLYNMLQVSN